MVTRQRVEQKRRAAEELRASAYGAGVPRSGDGDRRRDRPRRV